MSAESLERRLTSRPLPAWSAADKATAFDYLKMMESEATRCAGITEKLFNFSHAGGARRQRTDLAELIAGTIAVLAHVGEYRRKRVEFVARGAVAAEVNPPEMKQVLLNLLTNALDSIAADGRVVVELEQAQGQALISVRDNGRGMTDEVRAHLFEPFFTHGKEGKGTGLGLPIADRIVTGHGGRIEVESEGPGRGATFRVRLPLNLVQTRAA
jgi:signal transduction histidine kinase